MVNLPIEYSEKPTPTNMNKNKKRMFKNADLVFIIKVLKI